MKHDEKLKLLEQARLGVLETLLVGFLEMIEGKVVTDDEIEKHGLHANFAPTTLSVYQKGDRAFKDYYVWKGEHAVAHGFLDPKAPVTLYHVLVPKEEWPTALRLFVEQNYTKRLDTGGQTDKPAADEN